MGRHEVWQSQERQELFCGILLAMAKRGEFSTLKLSFLTNFVRTYRPKDQLELFRQLESLIQSCKTDMENVSGRGFHDEYLKALNEGNHLAQGPERNVWQHYHQMMEMAELLKQDLTELEANLSLK